VPELHDAGDGEESERERKDAHRGLCEHQQLALIEVVGREARPRQQHELRAELERHHDPHGRRVVMRQLREHEPVLRGTLHPGADIRHERASGPHAVIEVSERTKNPGFHVLSLRQHA
jgi:hypothetical protein